MDINSAYSLFETQSASPVSTENKKQASQTTDKTTGDTVSISDEAKTMLAKMTRPLTGEGSASSGNPQDQGSQTDAKGKSGGAGGASGGGEAAASEDPIENLEAQIAKLQSQYQSIMQGSAPDEVREAQGAGLQQQISALEQQVSQLKSAKLKTA